nr:DNA-binding protein [Escherichia coli]
MKVTEPRLNTLIDNLNTLICEDNLLTRQEREDLVRAVAAIGAMKARVSMKKAATPSAAKSKAEKRNASSIPVSRMPENPGRKKKGRYCWMRWKTYRMSRLRHTCSGYPKSWAGLPTAWPVRSRHSDTYQRTGKISSGRFLIKFVYPA